MRLIPRTPEHESLTDSQWETLMTAYRMGYFEVPRNASLEDVADELGVTHQSTSERMRRAHDAVCEALWHEMVSYQE